MMRTSLYVLVFFGLGLVLQGGVTANQIKKPKKLKKADCDLVMSYLSDIWNTRDSYCQSNRVLAWMEISKLITKEGCLMNQPLRTVIKYLGKPDEFNGRQAQYNLKSKSQLVYTTAVIFYFKDDADSTIIDCTEVSSPIIKQ